MFNTKKQYFKRKLKHEQQKLWELEFKIIQSRKIREGVRQDRDRSIEAKNRIEVALKDEKLPKEVKTQYEADLKSTEDNIKRYEAQIEMIDKQISGVAPSGEGDNYNPGQTGLLEIVESGVELRKMIADYIKTI